MNIFKPTISQINFLDTLIDSLSDENEEQTIYVLTFFKLLMDNVFKAKPTLNEKDMIIKDIIESSPKNTNISLAKIETEYNKTAKLKGLNPIKKSSIHNIIRNKLHYRFKKISIKTENLLNNDYTRKTFYFLKIFLR